MSLRYKWKASEYLIAQVHHTKVRIVQLSSWATGSEDTSEPFQGSLEETYLTLALIDNAITQRNHQCLQSREFSRRVDWKRFSARQEAHCSRSSSRSILTKMKFSEIRNRQVLNDDWRLIKKVTTSNASWSVIVSQNNVVVRIAFGCNFATNYHIEWVCSKRRASRISKQKKAAIRAVLRVAFCLTKLTDFTFLLGCLNKLPWRWRRRSTRFPHQRRVASPIAASDNFA